MGQKWNLPEDKNINFGKIGNYRGWTFSSLACAKIDRLSNPSSLLMRHSSENIQQHLRPFTATTITRNTPSDRNNNHVEGVNVNSDTILSLLNSHTARNSVNNHSNQYLNINRRSVSSPVSGKLGRELSVASVNALYEEYCTSADKNVIKLYNQEHQRSMHRLNSESENRKGTPIPEEITARDSAAINNAKNESLMEDLDDIIESPKLSNNSRYPVKNDTNIWINTSTASDETVAADSSVLMGQKSTDSDPFGAKIIAEEHPLGTPLSFDAAMLTETELNSVNNSKTLVKDQQITQSFLINERQKNEMEKMDPPKEDSTSQRNNSARSKQSTSKSNHFSLKHYMSNNNRKVSDSSRKQSNSSEGLDPESLMFRDGRRKIDMVLCYEEEEEGVMTEQEAIRREQRRVFQENLIKEGLEIEIEPRTMSFDEKTSFVKIHIPWRVENRYAEVMNLKLPVKRFITISVKAWDEEKETRQWRIMLKKYWNMFREFRSYDKKKIENEPSFWTATEGGVPEEMFIVKDRMTHFTSAQRSMIVMQILLRTRFDDTERVGIRRLLNDATYVACFPLHEGRYDRNHSTGQMFDRRILYLEWARPSKLYKKQPLCLVRKYFGDKIGFYFCWLGFYTKMLYFPAIVGTLCFLYGLLTMSSVDNTPSKEICDKEGVGNITLCPLCDKACSYQLLVDSCLFARLTYLFDNPSTVFFAIFMSFWATTFLELWKRKQSVLVWEWDLQGTESDEEPRPEFETSVKTFRINPVTREKEPYMPFWSKASRYVLSASGVLFMISVVLGAVLGTIIYRISLVSVIYGGAGWFIKTHAKLFTTMTAALINLIIIMLLTRVYHRIAIYLTNLENPRTQTEYEDSYTFKIFFFEFMNYYSSLIYIAFFKGRFYEHPGDAVARKSEFYRLKGDICDPAGCLSELCIQLAVIMVGKQTWNNIMEYIYPTVNNWLRQRRHKQLTKDASHLHMAWEQDYHLQDPGRLALFDEYLEMILQYGFVTLFVAAFPLAPLFALLNNVAEIRLDAYKMVTQARRPLAERVEDIGAWYGILRSITYIAIVSNAFVIAYTSDFIPRMVYKYVYSPHNDLTGYIMHSLSEFNTSDYREEWGLKTQTDPEVCFYRGYRKSFNETDDRYGLSPQYWHVFAARLAFVVVFEHVVFILTGIFQLLIPDIPVEVKTQMQREQLLAKEAKYQHGLKKSKETEYTELINALREQNNNSRQGTGLKGSWARRLSRLSQSDSLDAHVEVSNRQRRSMESTVWEDP
ncbi:anoctamin-4 [Culicoides brevitarsis]|uniref:anoctamin-4 n=1 Tax=Culicoides brevitarsis TaxID=469753 RepID=UPI00307C6A7D